MTYPSFTTGEVLTAADMNAVGLWRMIPTSVTTGATISGAQVTLAGQTNYTINGIFNTNFTEYLLIARMTSTNGDIYCQLTSGGTATTTNTYNYSMMQAYGGAGVTTARTANTNSMTLFAIGAGSTVASTSYCEISGPFLAEATLFTVQNNRSDNAFTLPANYLWYGNQTGSTSFDGLKIFATGTVAGRLSVYGRTK